MKKSDREDRVDRMLAFVVKERRRRIVDARTKAGRRQAAEEAADPAIAATVREGKQSIARGCRGVKFAPKKLLRRRR